MGGEQRRKQSREQKPDQQEYAQKSKGLVP
jgi:hypothetical protein